jgi:hypothetical protein
MSQSKYTGPLPTIGDTRAMGVTAFSVTSAKAACIWSADFDFDALRLPDEMAFVHIPRHRRFVCSRCGFRQVSVMPDWRQYAASGNGRRVLKG